LSVPVNAPIKPHLETRPVKSKQPQLPMGRCSRRSEPMQAISANQDRLRFAWLV